ncbi:MAG: hypothetical protein U0871_04475 [Gemmataceae bacterium]
MKGRDARVNILVWSMHPESLAAEPGPPRRRGSKSSARTRPRRTYIVEAIRRAGQQGLVEQVAGGHHQAVSETRGRRPARVEALADRELEVAAPDRRGPDGGDIAGYT